MTCGGAPTRVVSTSGRKEGGVCFSNALNAGCFMGMEVRYDTDVKKTNFSLLLS